MTMLRNAGSLKNDKKFNMCEIVIDTETTGLDPLDGHRIIEIGAVELVNRCPTGNTFHRYLCRECTMRADAIAVHGLTAEFLADKPLFAAVTDEFLAFVGDAPLVAHNAGFDIAFLNAELQRAPRSPIAIERVDWCWRGASILADVFEDIRKRLAMGEPSDRTGHRIQFRRIRRDFGSARTCQNFVDQAAHRVIDADERLELASRCVTNQACNQMQANLARLTTRTAIARQLLMKALGLKQKP